MAKPPVFNSETVYTVNYNGVEVGPVFEDLKALQKYHKDVFPSYDNIYYALHRKDNQFYKKGRAYIQKRNVIKKEVEV